MKRTVVNRIRHNESDVNLLFTLCCAIAPILLTECYKECNDGSINCQRECNGIIKKDGPKFHYSPCDNHPATTSVSADSSFHQHFTLTLIIIDWWLLSDVVRPSRTAPHSWSTLTDWRSDRVTTHKIFNCPFQMVKRDLLSNLNQHSEIEQHKSLTRNKCFWCRSLSPWWTQHKHRAI